jgi:glutathione peroxidase
MTIAQHIGFAAMLAEGLAGRGSRGLSGARPLDWSTLTLPALGGGMLSPDLFRGRVVLAVNTASRCVFTGQLRGLQRLWRERRDAGLTLLGVPSNDFAQEPLRGTAIREFCERRCGADLPPLLAEQRVIGADAHPLYSWAAAEGGRAAVPRWNFHKLLIGRDGRLRGAFTAAVGSRSPRLVSAIDDALAPG